MRVLKRLLLFVDDMNEGVGKFVSFLILIIIPIFSWEVLVRNVFNSPTQWAHESTAYLFAALFMVGGAYAMKIGSFVNVDIIYTRLPLRTKAVIDILTAIVFFLYVGTMLWMGLGLAVESVRKLETSMSVWAPPLYPYKIILVLGAFLVLLQGLTKLVRSINTLIMGKESLL